MNQIKKSVFVGIGLLSMLLVSPAMATSAKANAKAMIVEAENAQKQAASVNGEWRDVGKFIKKAKKALSSGDVAKARKLASIATEQAQLGYEQAMSQKTLRMPSYLR